MFTAISTLASTTSGGDATSNLGLGLVKHHPNSLLLWWVHPIPLFCLARGTWYCHQDSNHLEVRRKDLDLDMALLHDVRLPLLPQFSSSWFGNRRDQPECHQLVLCTRRCGPSWFGSDHQHPAVHPPALVKSACCGMCDLGVWTHSNTSLGIFPASSSIRDSYTWVPRLTPMFSVSSTFAHS